MKSPDYKRLTARPVLGRLRLAFRWSRFTIKSAISGKTHFAANGARALCLLLGRWCLDHTREQKVCCNFCDWRGHEFYPNVGLGYFEKATTCPGCGSQDRHRSLLCMLVRRTDFFKGGVSVVEVAPMRCSHHLCTVNDGLKYTSFDLERFASEKGDITKMRFADNSVDYFLCLHVLEHVPEEEKAISEIIRVLRPEGAAVLQVPIHADLPVTVDLDAPDPDDVHHVRRYGQDFPARLSAYGLEVTDMSVESCATQEEVSCMGLSREPFYFARPQ